MIYASILKPDICVINDICTKPCDKDEQPLDQDFFNKYSTIIEIDSGNEEQRDTIARLSCVCIDTSNQDDMSIFSKTGFSEDIERATGLNMPLDNLVIVHQLYINTSASFEVISKAFEKIHCIVCRAASIEIKEGHNIGIYFDFSCMNNTIIKLLSASLSDYIDGDMRKEEYENGIYIHKIPWNTNN